MSGGELVVIGNGMVGQRFVDALRARDPQGTWRVTVLAEEGRPAYDRVRLSAYFDGVSESELNLHTPHDGVRLRLGEPATAVDRDRQVVTTAVGEYRYDALVLATGSYAFVPPVAGTELPGVFVYRTLDDLAAIRAYARGRRVGAVIGGGLLGLEAANALRLLGLSTDVVEFAPRLMPVQVDQAGGAMLRRYVDELGVRTHLGVATTAIRQGPDGGVAALELSDGTALDAELVVVAAGIRPRDQLARDAGLPLGPRGGVLVDATCRTADERIWAVGECAAVDGTCHGLVAPGYATAEVVADRLVGGAATFPGADTATKLKLLGVDVASFGDAHGTTEGCLDVTFTDPATRVYAKLVLSDDAHTLLGGVLVGDASAYPTLRASVGGPLPAAPLALLAPDGGGADAGALPAAAQVCSCNAVTRGDVDAAIADGCADVPALKACTRAGTSCGSCVPMLKQLLDAAGVAQSSALCEHFDVSRRELFEIVRVRGIRTFSRLVTEHGRGRGCDICKPVVASILASLGGGHVLDGEQASLQDTNDHFLANLQRDGSYSVVPRIPGGEITPEKLIVIGEVARDFQLYTKITGGQRIDLFGARVEQLPQIWRRLVDAGFESGHAYGKALRTVKSCVGETWCRYGVQDSVGLAVALELRYRGLRAPHKLKSAVSGCARECAEARSKDFGIIATETGWNLYVGGNGGFRPRHADLFATDLSTETLIRIIDRFLIYYIRTADRLQRTAGWIEAMDGGLDHLRSVIVDDSLGLCEDLDAAMARHVSSYSDEWRDVLDDPDRLRRYTSFVNAPDVPDPSITFTRERGQPVPVRDQSPTGSEPTNGHRRQPVTLGLPEVRR
ncbi:nitrite reductase large subunit NirB [Micromonospora saelicesensis]|uniref:assimilatory sulfite reductase (ferredoxin) n=1 Tax=Micromonospora saelicesensis TaxID=285676 RepID=A0A1C4YC72_9ACTN|nr:nitrite reductase large subunit NirB [Micromonospora saelicesensis]RAO04500.1 Nitrite reductase (NADH) [Micromonospora saelicesensis]RAO41615.1 Nitrite reductase (NADH) [Micromonospora saelicesensis]RAO57647.1 Nitrite reductase (NADH) [Micromonospora saelicesensis]SCF18270.1 assimilatory nitrite reductase (NAD(P)H) large subunit precursor [Micromonospora saelicesensis]